jgi:hypothetical protein
VRSAHEKAVAEPHAVQNRLLVLGAGGLVRKMFFLKVVGLFTSGESVNLSYGRNPSFSAKYRFFPVKMSLLNDASALEAPGLTH